MNAADLLRCGIHRILLLSLLPALAAAQSNVSGPYDSESFEAPRYAPGRLPGLGFADGQDGWMLFDSLALQPNLGAATVQTAVARSGQRAVKFDAARLTPQCFGELRRNAMFNLTTGAIEIEMDFLITSSSSPTDAWEIYTQPAPNPQSAQMRWWIHSSGRVEFLSTPNRVLVATNHFVTRDVWHHARSVVDIAADTTQIFIDGALVGSGQPIGVFANLPAHGFTQVNAWLAGNDSFYLDNVQIRERTAPHGLGVDLAHIAPGQRAVVTFRLEGGTALAGRPYALLGSFAGSTPGLPLGGGIVLPLNQDWFFDLVLGNLGGPSLPGFVGAFNPTGFAEASLDTLFPVPTALLGQTATFAYAALNPFDAVSSPVRVRIAP